MKHSARVLVPWVLWACTATTVHANPEGLHNADLLDNLLSRFADTASGWSSQLVDYGTWLFWSLVLLSMVWTYGMMALRKADVGEFFAETVRFLTTTGFFLWILRNGPEIATSIMDSCRAMASKASGLNQVVSPSGIMDIGFDIAFKVADKSSVWSPATSTVGLLMAVVILIVLALISINLLIILITGWILAYGAVFLLGFGGGRWTQDIAIQYYKTVLATGMEMFAMVLLVGIGKSFIDQYYAAMGQSMAFKELLVMLVVAFVLLFLVNKIPARIAGIVGGGGGGGGGGLGSFGAGAALGSAAVAAGVASQAAGVAMGGLANLAGGASALKAAFHAAQQSMAQESSGGSGAGRAVAGALGSVGATVAAMGAELAKGGAQTIKEGLDGMKEAAKERISETFGGKVAENIQSSMSGSASQESAATGAMNDSADDFSGDGLGQGRAESTNDEVADFVNRGAASAGEGA
ncbi:TPA: P-type conjugative transfer protein TrbL [Legionella pneumophila]